MPYDKYSRLWLAMSARRMRKADRAFGAGLLIAIALAGGAFICVGLLCRIMWGGK